jgi:CRP/FNR family transcriptional regulator, cyclic AMP receptor protein
LTNGVGTAVDPWWNDGMPTTRPQPAGSSRRPAIRLLKDVPLFETLTRPQLDRLADLAREVTYGPGRMIVRDGTPGVAFYVITEGRAKVIKGKIASARGSAALGPGDFFGELALLDGGPRSASVVADGSLTTIRIERAPFRSLLKDEPDIALKLLEGMARRMRGMSSAHQL